MFLKLAATAHTDTTWMQQVHTMGMEGRYFTQKRSIRFHTTWYVTHFKYACFIGFPLKWASWSYGKCCGTVKHHLPSPGGFPAHNHAAKWMSMTFCLFPALLMGFIPALSSFFNWVSHFHLIKRTRCINTRLHKLGEKWINVWEVCRQYKQSKSNRKKRWKTHIVLQGHVVNSNTLKTISMPVGICHMNRMTFNAFKAMCRLLAVSFPFCIAGTRDAAAAHNTVIAASQKTSITH